SPVKSLRNRSRFRAAKAVNSLPVIAVGGIRRRAEDEQILQGGVADMVCIGRPFYADPDLARRMLGDDRGRDPHDHGLCRNSNMCVPAQMLGMKGVDRKSVE